MAQEMTIRMLLTLLQSEYPGSFVNMDARTMRAKIELWETEFRQDDIRLVYAAVRMYMQTPKDFAPSIGQIRENMRILLKSEAEEITDQEAWLLVSKACANGIHHSREEFEKLPPEIQKAVGGHEQLKAWAMMDSETVESVVASNFKRTFRTAQERQKQMDLIPADMREMLLGVSQNLRMEGGGQKQIAAPRERLVPINLQPLIRKNIPERPAEELPVAQPKEYKAPPSDEWERKREEAMKKLSEGKENQHAEK